VFFVVAAVIFIFVIYPG